MSFLGWRKLDVLKWKCDVTKVKAHDKGPWLGECLMI